MNPMMTKSERMAEYLGIDMNVPFRVKTAKGYIYGCPYIITDGGIYDRNGNAAQIAAMGTMFSRNCSIEICDEKAWHMDSEFYYIDTCGDVLRGCLKYSLSQISLMDYGNIFHTKEEAESYRDKIKAMLNNRK